MKKLLVIPIIISFVSISIIFVSLNHLISLKKISLKRIDSKLTSFSENIITKLNEPALFDKNEIASLCNNEENNELASVIIMDFAKLIPTKVVCNTEKIRISPDLKKVYFRVIEQRKVTIISKNNYLYAFYPITRNESCKKEYDCMSSRLRTTKVLLIVLKRKLFMDQANEALYIAWGVIILSLLSIVLSFLFIRKMKENSRLKQLLK